MAKKAITEKQRVTIGDVTFSIQSGVPMPSSTKSFIAIAPWDEMEVGDSFHVVDMDLSTKNKYLYNAGIYAKREGSGKRFRAREVEDGYRFWRVK